MAAARAAHVLDAVDQAFPAASISSVIDSIAYEPANGSTVAVRSVSLAMTCWVRMASLAALVLGSASASS